MASGYFLDSAKISITIKKIFFFGLSDFATPKEIIGITLGAEKEELMPQGWAAALEHWFMPRKDSQFLVNLLARTITRAQSCIISKSRYSNIGE
jgi:hypothetical protein